MEDLHRLLQLFACCSHCWWEDLLLPWRYPHHTVHLASIQSVRTHTNTHTRLCTVVTVNIMVRHAGMCGILISCPCPVEQSCLRSTFLLFLSIPTANKQNITFWNTGTTLQDYVYDGGLKATIGSAFCLMHYMIFK